VASADHKKPNPPNTRLQEGEYEVTVPTVADRIAQTVVAMQLEKRVEPKFHPDSYGYRPGRSALDAVGTCRRRCWEQDWVVDLDIQKFFDSVDHSLMVKAVEANTDQPWVVLYVKRWLVAPIQHSGTSLAATRWLQRGHRVGQLVFGGQPFEELLQSAVLRLFHPGYASRTCKTWMALAS
jgi:Reverse transcriptase (RNA-dependent DNA polymerase)